MFSSAHVKDPLAVADGGRDGEAFPAAFSISRWRGESERILLCFFFSFFFLSVSGSECLSLDVVSLSVERCCFLLVVDCMYNI